MILPADRIHHFSEYYFSKKLREIRALQDAGRPIINLGIGSPDLPPAKEVIDALGTSAALPDIHGYQSYQGLPALHDAIRSFYNRKYLTDISDLEVLPMMGSKEAITHISLAYLNPGDQVLIPELGYPTYTSVSKMVGARPVYYTLREHDYEPDWEKLEAMDLTKVKLMWLNYPHMPTGAKGSLKMYERYVSFAHEHGMLLCHDNPYSFIGNDTPRSLMQVDGAGDVTLELSSLSKTFNMAGWRVGWVIGREKLVKPVLQIKSNMDSGMFYGVQQAAIAALNLGNEWFAQINALYSKRRYWGEKIFDSLNCWYQQDQAGMFLWAKSPKPGEEFVDDLLERFDTFIAPGFIFGEAGESYVRMSLCASEQKLEEVYNRIK